MFRNTRGGLSRPSHSIPSILPEYPIPKDLEKVLDVNEESELTRKSQMYSKVLESLSAMKYVDLSENHYVQLLKLGLYLEGYERHEEMKKRKLFKQVIHRIYNDPNEILFKIHVKDMDEERPWIRKNDFIDVIDTKTYRSYTLRVTSVMKTDIVASDDAKRLCKIYKPRHLYDIHFHFQNYPLRCDHLALWIIYKENVITYLFPHKSKQFINMESETYETLTMLNPNIETNPEQKQAVLNILNKSSFPAPYILYGPPGTGKTATLVEAICQIHNASPSNHIFVCTPSNTAADEVAKRLLKFVNPSDIYRVYAQSKDGSTIEKELKSCSYYGGSLKNALNREDIDKKAILISTLCAATRFVLMNLKADYFSHIFIDEAGQGTEPDMLIPISIASSKGELHSQIILAGDPQQLGPTVISKLADIILGRSILERLMSYDTYQKDCYNNYNPKYITKLLHNYRSHSKIIHISNQLFYNNELVPKFSNDAQKVDFPIIFHGVEGIEEKYSYSTSTFNYEEIRLVLRYVYKLLDNETEFGKVTAEDIGIVTPFKLQSKRIKEILRKKDCEERKKLKDKCANQDQILKKEKKVTKIKKSDDVKKKDNESKQENENAKEMAVKIEVVKEKLESEVNTDGQENQNTKDVDVKTEDHNDKLACEVKIDVFSVKTDNDKIMLLNQNGNDIKVKIDKHENEIECKDLKDNNVETVKNANVSSNCDKNVIESENQKDNSNVRKKAKKNHKRKCKKDDKSKTVPDENQIKCRNLKDINVGTVELFQGQERKIMIMTAVRSKLIFYNGKEHMGFLSNPKRFNVAMSRAQNALIVVGNPGILQKDDMWQYLLKYCIDNGSYRGFEFALRNSSTEKLEISESQSIATSESLFKQQPFKLFALDGLDSAIDIPKTVDQFVEPGRDKHEEQIQRRLRATFKNLNINRFSLDIIN